MAFTERFSVTDSRVSSHAPRNGFGPRVLHGKGTTRTLVPPQQVHELGHVQHGLVPNLQHNWPRDLSARALGRVWKSLQANGDRGVDMFAVFEIPAVRRRRRVFGHSYRFPLSSTPALR